jgi:DNA-binding LacI/PurR family transcriptional regulator
VVCSSDAVAAVVVNVAHSLGLVVGRDVAVTGFDGGAIGMFTEPTLTSVRIPVEQIARELIHRCRREIESGPTQEPGLLVPTELVLGGSA